MRRRTVATLAIVAMSYVGAVTQTLSGPSLVNALRNGGYVLVVRHARAPLEPPDERTAEPGNTTRERQLDQQGREDALALGAQMRRLRIPVATVLTSPTYRARQTVSLAGWTDAREVLELGDRAQGMQGVTEVEGAWLRERVSQSPGRSNAILVTHLPNITRAFPSVESVAEGDTLVFAPSGTGSAALIGRIPIGDWRSFK